MGIKMPGKVKKDPKAAAAAAEERRKLEEERLKEEKRRSEEERLRREAEERTRLEKESLAQLQSPQGQIKDLRKWFSSLPISKKYCLTHIDRAFSDGYLVAEVIAHYLPQVVCTRCVQQYFSSDGKLGNWLYLNRRVFPKLGFKCTPTMIDKIVTPWKFFNNHIKGSRELKIYKLLCKLRDALGKQVPGFYDYRKKEFQVDPTKPDPCAKKRRPYSCPWKTRFSKIEIQLAQGVYDFSARKDLQNPRMCSSMHNSVLAEVVFDDNGNIICNDPRKLTYFDVDSCTLIKTQLDTPKDKPASEMEST